MEGSILAEVEALLFPDGGAKEGWVTNCPVSISVYGDRMAFAAGAQIALVTKDKRSGSFKASLILGEDARDKVTALLCLPLTDSSK